MQRIVGLCIIVLFLLSPGSVSAATFRSGSDSSLKSSETISGTLYIAGDVVDIAGIVEGDLVCAGNSVTITGRVDGDILCAGSEITVRSDVGQDARIIGRLIRLTGDVGKNATVIGQDVYVNNATFAGELALIGQDLSIENGSASGILIAGNNASFSGNVVGDLDAFVRSLQVGAQSSVSGMIRYPSDASVAIDSGAEYGGVVTTREMIAPDRHRGLGMVGARRQAGAVYPLIGLLWWVIASLVLTALFPKLFRRFVQSLGRPVHSVIAAVLFGALLPFVVLFLVISLIGIPMIFILMPILMLIYIAGRVTVALLVGDFILRTFNDTKTDRSLMLTAVIGMMLFWFAARIPYLGPWVGLAATIVGIGSVVLTFFFRGRAHRHRK